MANYDHNYHQIRKVESGKALLGGGEGEEEVETPKMVPKIVRKEIGLSRSLPAHLLV